MNFSMVVFDMAGTTVDDSDNAVARCVCDALRAAGVQATESQVDPVMGMPKPLAIRHLLRDARGVVPPDAEADRIHTDFQRRVIDHYRTAPTVKELDGASELFRGLRRRGVRVALDTGFDRATLDTIVERLAWGPLLDDTIASDEVSQGRPHPELIHVLMRRAGIDDPRRVAKLGDSVSDVEEGLRAECGFVGAILGDRTRPALPRFPTVVPIAHLREVIPALERASLHGATR